MNNIQNTLHITPRNHNYCVPRLKKQTQKSLKHRINSRLVLAKLTC